MATNPQPRSFEDVLDVLDDWQGKRVGVFIAEPIHQTDEEQEAVPQTPKSPTAALVGTLGPVHMAGVEGTQEGVAMYRVGRAAFVLDPTTFREGLWGARVTDDGLVPRLDLLIADTARCSVQIECPPGPWFDQFA